MVKYSGQGGASNAGTHYETNGKLDVHNLSGGEESFTTIGYFNTDGKSSKFKTIHKNLKSYTAMITLTGKLVLRSPLNGTTALCCYVVSVSH